jgi:hypothetical protein
MPEGETPRIWAFKDRSDAEILRRVAQEHRVRPQWNSGGAADGAELSQRHYKRCKNVSGETIPPHALMAVTGVYVDGRGIWWIEVDKPSATLHRGYAVNSHLEITTDADDDMGICFTSGSVRVLYNSAGTPDSGQGWGPKVDSWEAELGSPACLHSDGEYDGGSGDVLLHAVLSPITTLLCKANSSLATGGPRTNYTILSGTFGSETASGFTAPALWNYGDPIDNDQKFLSHWANNGWSTAGAAGDPGSTSLSSSGNPVEVMTNFRYNSTAHQYEGKFRTIQVLSAGAEGAWEMLHLLTSIEVAANQEWGEATLLWERTPIYVAERGDAVVASFSLTSRTFVVNVFDGSSHIKQTKITAYVFEPGANADSNVIGISACP